MATTTIKRDVVVYDTKLRDNTLVSVEIVLDLDKLATMFAGKVCSSVLGKSTALQGAIKAKRVNKVKMERAIKAGQPKVFKTRNRLRRLTADGLPKEYE